MNRRRIVLWTLVAAGFVGALAMDGTVHETLAVTDPARKAAMEQLDLYRMFRLAGYFPVWLAVAAAVLLIDLGRHRRGPYADPLRRPLLLVLSTSAGGLTAELVKMIVGRLRPGSEEAFRPFLHGFVDSSNLSMPSSHAAVAFAGAFAVGFIWPRAAPVAVLLAVGCALTRLLAGAHYFSDVYAGMIVGYALTSVVWRIDSRLNAGAAIGAGL